MSRNKKPRKAYRRKEVSRNTIGLALHYAAKPTHQDREEVLGPMRNAIKALREGVGTEMDWSVAAGSVAVAKAIEREGVVRGLHEHIALAEAAMQGIYDRAMRTGGGRWTRTALWFNEMDALGQLRGHPRLPVQPALTQGTAGSDCGRRKRNRRPGAYRRSGAKHRH